MLDQQVSQQLPEKLSQQLSAQVSQQLKASVALGHVAPCLKLTVKTKLRGRPRVRKKKTVLQGKKLASAELGESSA